MPSFHAAAVTSLLFAAAVTAQEPPTWEQLDARPLPQWFADAKFGIFIHWGVYSVPSFCDTSTYSEWYEHWLDTNSHGGLVRDFHKKVYGADTPYRAFAEQFRCELWKPDDWASTFRRAGADYVVLTSKHHDGFALWPDSSGDRVRGYPWNAGSTGPERDLVGELATAVRRQGIRFGLYYSFLEWHNPIFERSIPDYV
ncbi:MAG: alpha-L-fucosidase, partial [Planctomycetota bacterium]